MPPKLNLKPPPDDIEKWNCISTKARFHCLIPLYPAMNLRISKNIPTYSFKLLGEAHKALMMLVPSRSYQPPTTFQCGIQCTSWLGAMPYLTSRSPPCCELFFKLSRMLSPEMHGWENPPGYSRHLELLVVMGKPNLEFIWSRSKEARSSIQHSWNFRLMFYVFLPLIVDVRV